MKRIALAGGASCGKTSLARHLVTELYNNRTPKINAQHVPEFARDHINECRQRDGTFIPTMASQQMFFHEQMAREDALDEVEVEFMITDSPIFLTLVYTWPLVQPVNYNSRTIYAKMYDEWLQQYSRYDHIFVLDREKPFFQDGTRGGDEAGAIDMHKRITAFLLYHEIAFNEISGPDHTRVSLVLKDILASEDVLKNLDPGSPVYGREIDSKQYPENLDLVSETKADHRDRKIPSGTEYPENPNPEQMF